MIEKTDTYGKLLELFFLADEKYNSVIFDLRKDMITPFMKVDSKIIGGILAELYYPVCPYEFSVLSVEILGSAYEQFLGKVIRPVAAAVFCKEPTSTCSIITAPGMPPINSRHGAERSSPLPQMGS